MLTSPSPVWGFAVNFRLAEAVTPPLADQIMDAFIAEAIEGNGLYVGGGMGPEPVPNPAAPGETVLRYLASFFVCADHPDLHDSGPLDIADLAFTATSTTEAHRAVVDSWLAHSPAVDAWWVGPMKDTEVYDSDDEDRLDNDVRKRLADIRQAGRLVLQGDPGFVAPPPSAVLANPPTHVWLPKSRPRP